MSFQFSSLEALVPFARQRAQRGTYDGQMNARSQALVDACSHLLRLSPEYGAVVIFTRDTGHHSGGWWKNPDYERCFHLSLSYRQHRDGRWPVDWKIGHDKKESERIAKAFFGDDVRWVWCEPPYSEVGKQAEVWHYRLFVDADWKAVKPRGEVYDKRNTPAGWQSFSDLHGWTPEPEQAPFFARSST